MILNHSTCSDFNEPSLLTSIVALVCCSNTFVRERLSDIAFSVLNFVNAFGSLKMVLASIVLSRSRRKPNLEATCQQVMFPVGIARRFTRHIPDEAVSN